MVTISELAIPKQKVFSDGKTGYSIDTLNVTGTISDVEDRFFNDGRKNNLVLTKDGIFIRRQDEPNYLHRLTPAEEAIYSKEISEHQIVDEYF